MAGKRVFPPEWYAAQAARRKQRAEAKSSETARTSTKKSEDAETSSKLKSSSKTKAKRGKAIAVQTSIRSDGVGGVSITRPYGKSTRTTTYDTRSISKYSLDRLNRVLESRRKDKSFRYRAWTGADGGVGFAGIKYKRYTVNKK